MCQIPIAHKENPMHPKEQCSNSKFTDNLRREIVEGLLHTHSRLNTTAKKTLEAASFLYALVELLNEKGFITTEELDERKRVVGERLVEQYRKNGNGVVLQDPEYDKYTFKDGVEIDCASRVHLCHAVCCRLPFALSKQDIREGIVHWDLGQPYLISHNGNGTCCHLDPVTQCCSVWEHRPVPCRGFDCRQDKRIWLNFEEMIINPDINKPDWPGCLTQEKRK
jgi:Fe-S-cluster containining protein